MAGYVVNIEDETKANETFRTVLYTAPNLQLVVMTLQAGEEIGQERHEGHDQFIRIEAGSGVHTPPVGGVAGVSPGLSG